MTAGARRRTAAAAGILLAGLAASAAHAAPTGDTTTGTVLTGTVPAGTVPTGTVPTGTPSPNVVEGLIVPAPGATTVVAGPVLPPLDSDAAQPERAVLDKALDALVTRPSVGGDGVYLVVDALTGAQLAARAPGTARTPASTAKLLTATAALSLLGPQTSLPTTVVTGATDDEIVLVGGGDVLLGRGVSRVGEVVGHGGLTTLARRTAAALRAAGTTTVAVRLDDTIFTGPRVSPRWAGTDVADGYVAPISPVAIEAGTVGGKAGTGYPKRSPDPGMSAAKAFAALLEKQPGIRVTGQVARVKASQEADELARVESARVGDVVEFMLQHSDNTVAEVLARLVARESGRPATFADSGIAVLDRVALLGVNVDGAKLTGGSGLGSGSAISPRTLTGVLRLATSTEHPELRQILSGLPVAAATGTLALRFEARGDRPAAGVVRAKTGTLTGVHSLAGTVVDRDGRLLLFAVLAGGKNSWAAREILDDVGVRLASCGCRG